MPVKKTATEYEAMIGGLKRQLDDAEDALANAKFQWEQWELRSKTLISPPMANGAVRPTPPTTPDLAVKFLNNHAAWMRETWQLSPEGRSYALKFDEAVATLASQIP